MKIRPDLKDIPLSKNDRGFRRYLGSCLLKRAYRTNQEAMKAAVHLHESENVQTQVYCCEFCGNFHVTHHCRNGGGAGNVVFTSKRAKKE